VLLAENWNMANPDNAHWQMIPKADIDHLLSVSGLKTDKVETIAYQRYNAFHLRQPRCRSLTTP
jgi:hypothetical protein